MEPIVTHVIRGNELCIPRFELVVVDGPDKGKRVVSVTDELTIGTSTGASLVLTDPAVSRLHCVLRATERGLELRDLGSRNGTRVGSIDIVRGFIRASARVMLGSTTVVASVREDELAHPLGSAAGFGDLIGGSLAMRRLYPLLDRAAAGDSTVLIHGETGSGKELVAETIHLASTRRRAPFVTIDCAALSRELAESELFGHVRGAFTGADTDRHGAFAAADGGTVFLDEIGDLPLALQPLLLRALESKTIRRLGETTSRAVDVRVIAASHRDLRVEVNAKRFRSDLYYRLDVVRVVVPPLRDRDGDIALLATAIWSQFRHDAIPPALITELAAQSWPGNVRELKNAVERVAVVGWAPQPEGARRQVSYTEAKQQVIDRWERPFIERLLETHDYNLSRAARAAQMGRTHLRQLARVFELRQVQDVGDGDRGTEKP
jgi:transcriptional regulator with GAF, ATPase, and Fis domain